MATVLGNMRIFERDGAIHIHRAASPAYFSPAIQMEEVTCTCGHTVHRMVEKRGYVCDKCLKEKGALDG